MNNAAQGASRSAGHHDFDRQGARYKRPAARRPATQSIGSPMDDLANQTIKFRCPPELAADLPRPTPALLGLPDWFKAMPHMAFSNLLQEEQMTVKKCPPFIDAMTYGFLMPLSADL